MGCAPVYDRRGRRRSLVLSLRPCHGRCGGHTRWQPKATMASQHMLPAAPSKAKDPGNLVLQHLSAMPLQGDPERGKEPLVHMVLHLHVQPGSCMGTTGCRGHASAWIGWLCLNLPRIMAVSASFPSFSFVCQPLSRNNVAAHPSLPLSMGSAVLTTPSQARAGCAARFPVSYPHASSYLVPASRRAPR